MSEINDLDGFDVDRLIELSDKEHITDELAMITSMGAINSIANRIKIRDENARTRLAHIKNMAANHKNNAPVELLPAFDYIIKAANEIRELLGGD